MTLEIKYKIKICYEDAQYNATAIEIQEVSGDTIEDCINESLEGSENWDEGNYINDEGESESCLEEASKNMIGLYIVEDGKKENVTKKYQELYDTLHNKYFDSL